MLKIRKKTLVIFLTLLIAHNIVFSEHPNLDDFWMDKAEWKLDKTNIGAEIGMHFPSMFVEGDKIISYYIKHEKIQGVTGFAVARAKSKDGIKWEDDGYVLHRGGVAKWILNPVKDFSHKIGRNIQNRWSVKMDIDKKGVISEAELTFTPGPKAAEFEFYPGSKRAKDLNSQILELTILDAGKGQGKIIASDKLRLKALLESKKHVLNFNVPECGKIKLRVFWYANADLTQGKVHISEGNYPQWDSLIASFPGVFRHNGIYYLVYEGANNITDEFRGDIGLATSTDGLNFIKHQSNPILENSSESSSFESANIGTPSLYRENGVWYLYYHGFDWVDCQLGVAVGKDITKLKKYSDIPILKTVDGTFESGTIGKRSSIWKSPDTGYYYFAYECSTERPYNQARWSTALARSKDKLNWEKYNSNPIIPICDGFGNDGPEIIQFNGQTYLYVRTLDSGMNRYVLIKK